MRTGDCPLISFAPEIPVQTMNISDTIAYNRGWQLNSQLLAAVRAELLQLNSEGLPESLLAACGGFIADFLPLFYDVESLSCLVKGCIEEADDSLRRGDIEYAIKVLTNANKLLQRENPLDESARVPDQSSSLFNALKTLANAGRIFSAAEAAGKIDCSYLPEEVRKCRRVLTESAVCEVTRAGLQILPCLERKDKGRILRAFDALIKELIKAGVRSNSSRLYWLSLASQKRVPALNLFERNGLIDAQETSYVPLKLRSLKNGEARALIAACFTSALRIGKAHDFLCALLLSVAPHIPSYLTALYRGYESFEELREAVIKKCLEDAARYLHELKPMDAAKELHKALHHFSSIQAERVGRDECRPNLRTAKVLDRILYYLSFANTSSRERSQVRAWASCEGPHLSCSQDAPSVPAIAGLLTSLMEVADLLNLREMRTQVDRPGYDSGNFLAMIGNAAIEAGLAAGALPFTEEQLLWEAICTPIEARQKKEWESLDDPGSGS